MKKQLTVNYQEFVSVDEMNENDRELVRLAIEATGLSYAPYSHFNVGAAVRLSDGRCFTGANQENAAYPSGLCAERTAMFYAHAHRENARLESIAIAACQNGKQVAGPVSPCAACRQVMLEFEDIDNPMSVIMAGSERILKFERSHDLVPFSFDSF
ncbi:MAG: cytidine deaminase [Bacteroidaceae bacterium]|nr:cytidine deaminase [Bacteroidaceae bacterium]